MSDIKIGTLVAARAGGNDIIFGHVIDIKDIRYTVYWDNDYEAVYLYDTLLPYVKLIEQLKDN